MSDHADVIREESAWLADYADYGIRATEDQGGFVDGDADSHRAELVAALDALVAAFATSEKSREEYIEETIRLRAALFAAEAERDAAIQRVKSIEAYLMEPPLPVFSERDTDD